MTNKWREILREIEPNYDLLVKIMDDGPTIKPTIYPLSNKKFRLTLEEIWPESLNVEFFPNGSLDEKVLFVSLELEKWDNVKRISWDSWEFSSKRLAEKFITYYYMKWPQ